MQPRSRWIDAPLATLALAAVAADAGAQSLTLESVDASGLSSHAGGGGRNATAERAVLSADGRFLVFDSDALDLDGGNAHGVINVYVKDRASGSVARVSRALADPDGDSNRPAISRDGAWITFSSGATNLHAADPDPQRDVYVAARTTGALELASVASDGAKGDGESYDSRLSQDGRFVVFTSIATNFAPNDTLYSEDVFLRDRASGITLCASLDVDGKPGSGYSYGPALTPDGRFVAFVTTSNAIVPGDVNGSAADVILWDSSDGSRERVNVNSQGQQAIGFSSHTATLSADARFVAFATACANLVAGDSNTVKDIFVRDRQLGVTTCASVTTLGELAIGGDSFGCTLSDDGRFVVYESAAWNLAFGDNVGTYDVFVRDRLRATTTCLSNALDGAPAGAESIFAAQTPDARFVVFGSNADDLVLHPGSLSNDVFVIDRASGPLLERYCSAKLNSAGCRPRIAASGSPSAGGFDAFFVIATDVLPHAPGLFLWGRSAAAIPFAGGTLCVAPPVVRSSVLASAGHGPLCSGAYSHHLSQAELRDHAIGVGETLYGQFWSRDPGYAAPNDVGLTDALSFTIGP